MKLIQLQHDEMLDYVASSDLPLIPDNVLEKNFSQCYSFRRATKGVDTVTVNNVHACNRLSVVCEGNIICYALETDSPIAPLILWDLAHKLSVGNSILIVGELIDHLYFQRKYYEDSFKVEKNEDGTTLFLKIKPLPAEENIGLEEWTFGIPTGPGDATMLNAIVKRIIELPCQKKEILLCGRPGDNFKYWDDVRIVGEDIPVPPVRISMKKNRIAEEARYGNLCILHDRVFLPSDFTEAMRRFGDCYPLTTFQSLYFDDYCNFVPMRYSDYGVICNAELGHGLSVLVDESEEQLVFNPLLQSQLDGNSKIFCQNPRRYSHYSYPTGSLFIIKKEVMLQSPLNNNLNWEEFEDVEWGIRSTTFGVPNCVNPYTFSQSCNSRFNVCAIGSGFLDKQGNPNLWFPKTHMFKQNRKPFYKCTEQEAYEKYYKYSKKYCNNINVKQIPLTNDIRYDVVLQLLSATRFECTEKKISEFLKDVESLLLVGSLSKSYKKKLIVNFQINGLHAMTDVAYILDFWAVSLWRPSETIFMKSLDEFGTPLTFRLKLGSFFSSIYFMKNKKNYVFHPDGVKGYYRSILNSTPYNTYFEDVEYE